MKKWITIRNYKIKVKVSLFILLKFVKKNTTIKSGVFKIVV